VTLPKRATLTDVARLAGLSPTAVSMILNGKPDSRLSEESHQRVKAAAEALGYRPNIAARSLRTEITQTIGLISDVIATTRYASGLIKGTLEATEAAGHVLLVAETGGDVDRQREAISAVLDRQVDGIVFASMKAREVDVPPLPPGTPVVMLNATNSKHPKSVLPDEFAGGAQAVQLLLDAGHHAGIVILGKNEQVVSDVYRSVTVANRVAGINHAMQQAGAQFVGEISLDLWEPEEGYQATKALLQQPDWGTALLCMNDRIAFGAYQAITEAGLKIPQDVSLVSFDNDELAAYLRPGLTTIALPHEAMGRRAVEMLLAEMGSENALVPMPVIRRGSIRSLV